MGHVLRLHRGDCALRQREELAPEMARRLALQKSLLSLSSDGVLAAVKRELRM